MIHPKNNILYTTIIMLPHATWHNLIAITVYLHGILYIALSPPSLKLYW